MSKSFVTMMEKGNVNGALTNNESNGILPLNDNTLHLLQEKHPPPKVVDDDVLLSGEKPYVHPVIYESIDEEMVKRAALKTKGGSGPSGLDVDGWRKILASNNYGTVNTDLRKAFTEVIKTICTKKIEINTENNTTSLEAFFGM